LGKGYDLAGQLFDPRVVEPVPVFGQALNDTHHAVRQHIGWRGEDARQLGAQEPQTLADRNAALKKKSTDLIDNAGALADQSLAYPVQRLQIELLGGLRGYELHRWPLDCPGDRFRIPEVVLLSL
jgi:hypothetical protein